MKHFLFALLLAASLICCKNQSRNNRAAVDCDDANTRGVEYYTKYQIDMRQDFLDSAFIELKYAIECDSMNYNFRFNLFSILFNERRYQECLSIAKQLEILGKKQNPLLMADMAVCYKAIGDTSEYEKYKVASLSVSEQIAKEKRNAQYYGQVLMIRKMLVSKQFALEYLEQLEQAGVEDMDFNMYKDLILSK
jgi:hypothetical protein